VQYIQGRPALIRNSGKARGASPEFLILHNGEPFNAAAAVHSVKRLIDPAFKSEQISFFFTIKDTKKVDDLTVQILTEGPDPILPGRLYWMKMVPPKHSKDPKFAEQPVGTGP
jgi:peptide/nickel transport system substrate-binding protein